MTPYYLKFMNKRTYRAPLDEDGGAGGSDIDDDLDEDELDEEQAPARVEKPKTGEQEDGSVVVDLEDEEDAEKQQVDGDDASKEEKQPEAQDDEKALEAKRAARRQERQDRKNRAKEKEESTRRELAAERAARQQLEQRLAALEGRDRSREIAGVDNEIRSTAYAYQQAQQEYREAIEQHDGDAATKAQEKMLQARERYQRLETAKRAYEQQQKTPTPAAVNPILTNHVNKFLNEHKWFKKDSGEVDSNIVTTIDNSLAQEGWDPNSKEYWDELRARIKKYLPHRVASGKVSNNEAVDEKPARVAPPRQQKSVVSGGGGESHGAGKGTYVLSSDRVKAMKDAGVWDDPVKRKEMIQYYRNFDKQNSTKGK